MQEAIQSLSGFILALDTQEFWFFSAFLLIVSINAFHLFFIALKRSRLLTGQPTAKIRSAAQGCVELNGVAQLMPGLPIVSL